MVARYETRRAKPHAVRADDGYWYAETPVRLEVIEETDEPVVTGLYDQFGNVIVRRNVRAPMGFKR